MFRYNHNKHYTDLLLRQVPPGCQNALDVGCGISLPGRSCRHLQPRDNAALDRLSCFHRLEIEARTAQFEPASNSMISCFALPYPLVWRGDVTVAQRSAIWLPSKRHCTKPWNSIGVPLLTSFQRQILRHTTLSPSATMSSMVI